MGKVADGNNLLLGRGKIYFDRLSGMTPTGERFLGNCSALTITTTDELHDKYSSAEATAPLLKSANVRRTVEFALTLDEFTKENLALVLMGAVSALAQGSGTVTNEVLTAVQKDTYWRLAKRNVSLLTVTGPSGTPSYTAGTDYEVDAVTGRIYIIPGGTIANGVNLEVDYTYGADTSATVQGGVSNVIEGSIRFIGDPAAGPIYECEVWKVSMEPDGALALIGDDYGEFNLKGKVLADSINHSTEPLFRLIKRA